MHKENEPNLALTIRNILSAGSGGNTASNVQEIGFDVNGVPVRGFLIYCMNPPQGMRRLRGGEWTPTIPQAASVILINPDKNAPIRAFCIPYEDIVSPPSVHVRMMVLSKRAGFFIDSLNPRAETDTAGTLIDSLKTNVVDRSTAYRPPIWHRVGIEDNDALAKREGFYSLGVDIGWRLIGRDLPPKDYSASLEYLLAQGQLGDRKTADALAELATTIYNGQSIERYQPHFLNEQRLRKDPPRTR